MIISKTSNRTRIGRYGPLLALSLISQVIDCQELLPEYAMFQHTIRYMSKDGSACATRMNTHKLNVASSANEFVNNVDDKNIPAL